MNIDAFELCWECAMHALQQVLEWWLSFLSIQRHTYCEISLPMVPPNLQVWDVESSLQKVWETTILSVNNFKMHVTSEIDFLLASIRAIFVRSIIGVNLWALLSNSQNGQSKSNFFCLWSKVIIPVTFRIKTLSTYLILQLSTPLQF
jgi:hypothetical protein